jgi:hypothetical protein
MVTTLSQVDHDALERCIETIVARGDPGARQQIERMLAERPWMEVATFAAYGAQMRSLRLKLWQSPPCWIAIDDIENIIAAGDDGVLGNYRGARLLQRMLAAGLSKYEPNPVAALEGVEHKVAAAAGA